MVHRSVHYSTYTSVHVRMVTAGPLDIHNTCIPCSVQSVIGYAVLYWFRPLLTCNTDRVLLAPHSGIEPSWSSRPGEAPRSVNFSWTPSHQGLHGSWSGEGQDRVMQKYLTA